MIFQPLEEDVATYSSAERVALGAGKLQVVLVNSSNLYTGTVGWTIAPSCVPGASTQRTTPRTIYLSPLRSTQEDAAIAETLRRGPLP